MEDAQIVLIFSCFPFRHMLRILVLQNIIHKKNRRIKSNMDQIKEKLPKIKNCRRILFMKEGKKLDLKGVCFKGITIH